MRRKLQVFISSTYSDLRDERQAAVEAVLKAGHIPAGMELFTAGDKSQMKTIERWIDESDVYMLILGGRYGSIEASTGKSYTELEYEYALSKGKRMFSVVIKESALDEKVKNSGISAIEGENPKSLKAFREKVLTNIASFFDDRKDIKLCVHESLSDIVADGGLVGWVSGAEVPEVMGLQEEIARLRAENTLQAKEIANLSASSGERKNISKLQDTIKLLSNIPVDVPAKVNGGKEGKDKLLWLLLANKDMLINGVTNSGGSGAVEEWFYFKIAPKFKIHGIMEDEKVPGAQYRRSFVTPFGIELLAEMERRMAEGKMKESVPASSSPKPATDTLS